MRQLGIGLTAVGALVLSLSGMATAADSIVKDREKLYAQYGRQLAALAAFCDREGLAREAELTRQWLVQRDSNKLYVFVAADLFVQPFAAHGGGKSHAAWWAKFSEMRVAQAESLFTLARDAATAGQATVAYELINESLRENPDLERGRALLGYTRVENRWMASEAARKLRAGKTWHAQFGWLPATYVGRYDQGLRLYRNRWMTTEEDARLHAARDEGWELETDHFSITTSRSIQDAADVGRKLEQLHDVWRQVFAAYYRSEGELERVFAGRALTRRTSPAHQVVVYGDRDEYNRRLKPLDASIEGTLGYYLGSNKTAYFFVGKEQYAGNIYHEGTHQLFQEVGTTGRNFGRPLNASRRIPGSEPDYVGLADNFWVIEAVACYMESLASHEGYYTLGGFEEGRAPAARHRLLQDGFYVPLAELVTLGMNDLRRDNRLPMIYSQSAGLALFFMHYDGGRYRDAFLTYLKTVYAAKANSETLAWLTGTSYTELDRQYREYMQSGDSRQ